MIQSSLLFIAISSLFACLCAVLWGSLTPMISGVSLLVALVYCLWDWRSRQLRLQGPATSTLVKILYGLIIGGIYAHAMFLFYYKDGRYWIQDVFNLGDLSFHWGTIRHLAKGATFWPENFIYAGYRFRYPFGMDFFNALFENLGVMIHTHLPLVTLVGLLLSFWALHISGGPLLVFAVFFSAGLYDFWTPLRTWNLFQVQEGLDFKNLFLTVLVTQRGFLYALPAGLFLYKALKKSFQGEWSPSLPEKISLGLIWGALGFFHLHSFFFVSLYLGLLILWKKRLKTWLLTLVLAFLLGLPFVVNALWPEAGTNSLIHWSRGWAREEGVNYFWYWFKNMGPWLLAMMTAMAIFIRQKNWQKLVPTALAFALFLLFAHLILAPWNWDNIKLLVWCYVFGLLAIQDLLWNHRSAFVKALVFMVFFVPGFMVFVHSLPFYTRGAQWASERELNKATLLLKNQNVNQVLLVAPEYEHPALLLGHKLYMGYPGHVWSHGYNYGPREMLLNRYFAGEAGAVQALGNVDLIYQGPLEKRREKEGFQIKDLPKIGEALDHRLYRAETK